MKLFFIFSIFIANSAAHANLFSLDGKQYNAQALSPSLQQTIYDIEKTRNQQLEKLIDQAIFDIHVEGLAAKQKKPADEIRDSLLKAAEPSDKEAKAWFELNKHRIGPRDFQSIKADIKRILSFQKKNDKKLAIVNKLKTKGKFKSFVNPPVAPKISINTKDAPQKGSNGAKVTIIEFADYQCPHCMHAAQNLKKVLDKKKFKNLAKLIYMDFPINPSGISKSVAIGAFCAHKQNQFWPYHYKAFEMQRKLDNGSALSIAKQIKLDENKFKKCLASKEAKNHVEATKAEGERIGVKGTPAIYINGIKQDGYEIKDLEETLSKFL